ncbi:DUF3987 domain-containing protein [Methylobacterium bullatum]|uniref:DUF3987 domain-containing protein n=1 Tax=Methylobacterium bullatum TaxID=570505 RepID=UPI0030CF1CE5
MQDTAPGDRPAALTALSEDIGSAGVQQVVLALAQSDPDWINPLAAHVHDQTNHEPPAPSDDGEHSAFLLINGEVEQDALRNEAAPEVAGPLPKVDPTWEFPDLSLLAKDVGMAPVFPLPVLGDFWADWCRTAATNANAPVDFTVGTLLATAGAMLGNVRWPDVEGVWEHPSVLWVGLVGNPSTAKSPGMRPVRNLIHKIEGARAEGFEAEGKTHRLKAMVAEAKDKLWRRHVEEAVVNGKEVPPDWPEDALLPEMPVKPVLHVMDATIEALLMTAASSQRGLLQFSDELSAWFGGFDRYRSKGVSADRPFWLKAFDGDAYSVMRKGQDARNGVRAPVVIPHLSIGVIGSVQPDPLRQFLSNSDDGLAHRFLWMWPERTTSFKIPRRADGAQPPDDAVAFSALTRIDRLSLREDGEPVRIPVSAAAIDLLEAYGQEMLERAETVSSWYASTLGKVPGLALRLSAVLTYLRWSTEGADEPQEINAEAMRDAIRLMNTYFLPQAERVRQSAAVTDGEADARALIAVVREQGWERFTGRKLHRVARGRLTDLRHRKAACQTLVEAGLLREDFQRAGDTAGRKQEWYDVNPAVFSRMNLGET